MTEPGKTVLVITTSLGIGGRERIALNTVRCLESLGYRAVLAVFERREAEYPFDGELVNLRAPRRGGTLGKAAAQLRRAWGVLRLRKKYRVCCAYSLGAAANLANALSGLLDGGKTVVAVHGFSEIQKNARNRFLFHRADRVVCIAQDMRCRLLELFPKLNNAVVIENGYELPALPPFERTESAPDAPRLVTMGRLTRVKGLARLIESMAVLRRSLPGATLTVIGDGEEKEALTALAERLGIADAVRFMGYAADPCPILRACDLYALTSYAEGFPNALIEAMHCGLPVIAADCRSGPREILCRTYSPGAVRGVRQAEYGVLVENADEGFAARFAQAVLSLWKDRERVCAYREKGPERARDFSLPRYRERLKELLDESDEKTK